MDTNNPKGVNDASWEGIGYLMKRGWIDGRGRRRFGHRNSNSLDEKTLAEAPSSQQLCQEIIIIKVAIPEKNRSKRERVIPRDTSVGDARTMDPTIIRGLRASLAVNCGASTRVDMLWTTARGQRPDAQF
ncbi:hypothetical protein EVAR_95581_1 [Eumeta japonica]|uniref:Uncharacterized protein n=1 Tax=Eumeta variegata TaxID=151549 RepID=A0A4C1VKN3_EUMVA|nr:hypothetical protein EVAR_95581_1 [Eumeta japonica]